MSSPLVLKQERKTNNANENSSNTDNIKIPWRRPTKKLPLEGLIDCEFKPVYGSVCPPKSYYCDPCIYKPCCTHLSYTTPNFQSKLTIPCDSYISCPPLCITPRQCCDPRKQCTEIRDLLHLCSTDLENIFPTSIMTSCRIARKKGRRMQLCKPTYSSCPTQVCCDCCSRCCKPLSNTKCSSQERRTTNICQNACANTLSSTKCHRISNAKSPKSPPSSSGRCKLPSISQSTPRTPCNEQCENANACQASNKSVDTPACMPLLEMPVFDCLSAIYENILQGNKCFGNHFPDCTCSMCKKRRSRTRTSLDLNLEYLCNNPSNRWFQVPAANKNSTRCKSADNICSTVCQTEKTPNCDNIKLYGNHFEDCNCPLCRRRLAGDCICQKITDPKGQRCRSFWLGKTKSCCAEDSDKQSLRVMLLSIRKQLGNIIACTGEPNCPCMVCCKRRVYARIKPYSWYANCKQKPRCSSLDDATYSTPNLKESVTRANHGEDEEDRTSINSTNEVSVNGKSTVPYTVLKDGSTSNSLNQARSAKTLNDVELSRRKNTDVDLNFGTITRNSAIQTFRDFHEGRSSLKRDNPSRLRFIQNVNADLDSESYEPPDEPVPSEPKLKVHRSKESRNTEADSDDTPLKNLIDGHKNSFRRPFGLSVTERHPMMGTCCLHKLCPQCTEKSACCQDNLRTSYLSQALPTTIEIPYRSCETVPPTCQKRSLVQEQICGKSCRIDSGSSTTEALVHQPKINSGETANTNCCNKKKARACKVNSKSENLGKNKNEVATLLKKMELDTCAKTYNNDPRLEDYKTTTYKSCFPPPCLQSYTKNLISEDENSSNKSPYMHLCKCKYCHPSRLRYHMQNDTTGFFTQLRHRINSWKGCKKKKLEIPEAKTYPLYIELYNQYKNLPERMCCQIRAS